MFERLKQFVQTLIHSLNPMWYTNISNLKPKDTIKHMALVVVFSMGVMGILMLPSILNLQNSLQDDLGSFQDFKIRGTVNMTKPIMIPENDPELVIDINGEEKIIKDEKLLVTKEYVYFKPLGKPLRINVKKLLNPLEYKTEAAAFLKLFFISIIPGLLIFLFLMFAIKYTIIIGAMFGLSYFVLKLLLLYKVSGKRIFNIVAYAATLMIFLEIVFIPLNGKILVPLFQLLFLDFYLIPLLIFIVYAVLGLFSVEKKTPSDHKSSEWQF